MNRRTFLRSVGVLPMLIPTAAAAAQTAWDCAHGESYSVVSLRDRDGVHWLFDDIPTTVINPVDLRASVQALADNIDQQALAAYSREFGISMRFIKTFDIALDTHPSKFDVLYGAGSFSFPDFVAPIVPSDEPIPWRVVDAWIRIEGEA